MELKELESDKIELELKNLKLASDNAALMKKVQNLGKMHPAKVKYIVNVISNFKYILVI